MTTVATVSAMIGPPGCWSTSGEPSHRRDWSATMDAVTVSGTDRRIKHLMSKRPEYKAWQQIKVRCLNPNDRNFPSYGGREIGRAHV